MTQQRTYSLFENGRAPMGVIDAPEGRASLGDIRAFVTQELLTHRNARYVDVLDEGVLVARVERSGKISRKER